MFGDNIVQYELPRLLESVTPAKVFPPMTCMEEPAALLSAVAGNAYLYEREFLCHYSCNRGCQRLCVCPPVHCPHELSLPLPLPLPLSLSVPQPRILHTRRDSFPHSCLIRACSWQVGPGFDIKPYVVYTDLKLDPSDGLVVFASSRLAPLDLAQASYRLDAEQAQARSASSFFNAAAPMSSPCRFVLRSMRCAEN